MIDPQYIGALLGFLEIPKKHWQTAVERTVLASVRALHFLHRVRFGGLLADRREDRELTLRSGEDSDEDCYDVTDLDVPASLKRKKVPTSAGPELPSEDALVEPLVKRQLRHHHPTIPRQSSMSTSATARRTQPQTTGRTANPTHHSPRTKWRNTNVWSKDKCKQTRLGACNPDPAEAVEMDTGSPIYREGGHLPDYSHLARRKRKLRSSSNRVYDTDDPDGRNPKQPRHSTGDHRDMLWYRWRQLADRRRRN